MKKIMGKHKGGGMPNVVRRTPSSLRSAQRGKTGTGCIYGLNDMALQTAGSAYAYAYLLVHVMVMLRHVNAGVYIYIYIYTV